MKYGKRKTDKLKSRVIIIVGLLILASFCVTVGYEYWEVNRFPQSFALETSRIGYPDAVISAGYVRTCGSGNSFGPSFGPVCVGRYQLVFSREKSMCDTRAQLLETMLKAKYKETYDNVYKFDFTSNDSICSQLEKIDAGKESIDTVSDTFSYNQTTIDTGTFYIDCQIGTEKHPYELDHDLGILTKPAISDRTKVYGCVLQHNL